MPARSEPIFDVDFNGQMVKCKAQRNELVTIGIDGTWSTRLTVKKRVNEDAEAAALRKLGINVAGAARSSSDAAAAGPAAAPADAPGLLGSPAIFLDEVDSAVGAGRKRTEVKLYLPGSSETCGRAHTLRDKCSKSGTLGSFYLRALQSFFKGYVQKSTKLAETRDPWPVRPEMAINRPL